MLHRVCNESDNDYVITKGLQVTPDYLDTMLKFFVSENYEMVSLDECYNRITSRHKVKKFVAFTFDDGYVDNLTHALPVFEKYNAPFTIFLTTGMPDHKVILWWYLLDNLIMNNNSIQFSDEGKNYHYDTSTIAKKKDTFGKIRPFILESNHENLIPRLKSIFQESFPDLYDLTKRLSLTWEQVIELSKHPLVTIGAHTVNHYALSKLHEDLATKEINESISIIESKIGKPVLHLAYPIGTSIEASTREFKIAANSSLKTAYTAEKGNIFKHHSNSLYSLPRLGINEALQISNIDLYINGLTPFRDKLLGTTPTK